MKSVFKYLLSHALLGFCQAVFSYHNLAHLIFAKYRQILKKLNWLPFSIRCASHFFAHLTSFSHKRSPAGSRYFFIAFSMLIPEKIIYI